MLKTLGSRPLFAEVEGDWPPQVLALHGWGRNRGDLAEALQGVGRVASLDLPGFGMSPEPPDEEQWGTHEYAQEVLAALDDLSEPVVVVGHSFGGRVAVRLAARRPELVAGLVLTGAPIAPSGRTPSNPPLAYRLVRWAAGLGIISDGLLERARQHYGSRDYAAASPTMRGVLSRTVAEDYAEDLRGLTCPVVLVWGEDDEEVPMSVAEAAAAILPRAELVTLPGVGHHVPSQDPAALREAVQKVLAT